VVVVVAWYLAPFGVALLFQRGAFTAADTTAVAGLLRWGLLQLPFYFAVLVLVQLFASEGRFKEMAFVAVGIFVVKVLANFILIRLFGISGVLLATGVMGACSFGSYLLILLSSGSAKNDKKRPT
jgi:putative peptidoglycan lipid II flippase